MAEQLLLERKCVEKGKEKQGQNERKENVNGKAWGNKEKVHLIQK